jgi:hypothetical protein
MIRTKQDNKKYNKIFMGVVVVVSERRGGISNTEDGIQIKTAPPNNFKGGNKITK